MSSEQSESLASAAAGKAAASATAEVAPTAHKQRRACSKNPNQRARWLHHTSIHRTACPPPMLACRQVLHPATWPPASASHLQLVHLGDGVIAGTHVGKAGDELQGQQRRGRQRCSGGEAAAGCAEARKTGRARSSSHRTAVAMAVRKLYGCIHGTQLV